MSGTTTLPEEPPPPAPLRSVKRNLFPEETSIEDFDEDIEILSEGILQSTRCSESQAAEPLTVGAASSATEFCDLETLMLAACSVPGQVETEAPSIMLSGFPPDSEYNMVFLYMLCVYM
jgi:hypothetical protein